ncbi:hypothetical protein ACQP2F_37915 [Actinoplanes sp. CA-030573]|uniref:hypothetical protein n=1 Tax=Actinoplanes sp. CA-030573 TaxID=3239898 RepID=UPI003D92E692
MQTNTINRAVGMAAWTGAWVGSVLAPIHALSRFATADGAGDLESSVVRAWAEPGARLLRPLLSWSDADTVYVTYGRVWFPLILVATAAAIVVRRGREPRGAERWGWWITLVGYVVATLSTVGDYYTPWMDQTFAFVGIPAILTSILGSAVLGIVLLRRDFRPPATAWLLATWLPLFFVLSALIAMGAALLPMLWAWGIAGRFLARPATPTAAAAPASSPPAGTTRSR